MFHPETFPAELRSGPFTTGQAMALGVSLGKLRHRQILTLSRGIKTVNPAALSLALLARPYSQVSGHSAVSHATAFEIWGFPGFMPARDSTLIHVSRQAPYDEPRRRGVQGHTTHLWDEELACLDGLWITSRVRTWLDCSRQMSVDQLVVVADHLVRIPRPQFELRSQPYASLGELAAILERHKGTPGIQKARQALELARVGSDSAPESLLRLAVTYAGLPDPLINVPIQLAPGIERTPDQAYPEYRVAVEYDGGTHSDPWQVQKDIARSEDFTNHGWLEVRISKQHMGDNAKAALQKICAALYSRGWRPTPN